MRKQWLFAAGSVCAALSGCAGFWDEVTSRDFSVKTYLNPPEPMTVLRTSSDGDARAKAFRRIEEPLQHGGSGGDQDEAVKILSQAAMSEPQPLCRMAAIQSLGRFQDPRAVPALIGAYDAADQLTPDLAFMVRTQSLTALGETRKPEAANFLADVAKRPVKSDLADKERGQNRDVRLAAVRSLKNFPNNQAAAATAQQLAGNERDVAVRDRAKETYVALTGQEPPTPTTAAPPTAPKSDIMTVSGVKSTGP